MLLTQVPAMTFLSAPILSYDRLSKFIESDVRGKKFV
jgi:hypothetical protein